MILFHYADIRVISVSLDSSLGTSLITNLPTLPSINLSADIFTFLIAFFDALKFIDIQKPNLPIIYFLVYSFGSITRSIFF